MPKNEKVLRKVHSAPSAIVLPTKQATVIPAPSKWRRVSTFNTDNHLSDVPVLYAITLYGEAYDYNKDVMRQVEIQRLYRAYNPMLAVGSAVLNFFKDNARATITNIEILKESK